MSTKNIKIFAGVEGAQQARGIVVIIDVLRAASVASYLLEKGVTKIIPVATAAEAFASKNKNPDIILVGENNGLQIAGFDIGNTPLAISKRNDLLGKTVVHRSSTGTQGIVNATLASEIIFGSFVSVVPIIEHLRKNLDKEITLVPMYAPEDELCAQHIKSVLSGQKPLNMNEIKQQLSQVDWLQNSFLNPNNHDFPLEDFELCLQTGVFDFYPVSKNGFLIKRKPKI